MTLKNCMCGKKPKVIPGKHFYDTLGVGMIEIMCTCGCSVIIIRKDKPAYNYLRKAITKMWNDVCGVEE